VAADVLPPIPQGVSSDGAGAPPAFAGAEKMHRPGVAIRLIVRLEDFSNDDGPDAQPEGKPAKTPGAKAISNLTSLQALQAVRRASGEFDANLDAQVQIAKKKASATRRARPTRRRRRRRAAPVATTSRSSCAWSRAT
jgi:hypothetical protein